MRTLIVDLIIVGLLLVAGCKAAPTPTAVSVGGLEGIVSDASTGAPLSGAQVHVAGQVGVFTLTTDADGKYQTDGLPAGAYLVSAQATGYCVDVIQVGVVANVVSNGNVALEPGEVAAATSMPPLTPVPTPTPSLTSPPTPTLAPSVTPRSTATSTPTPSPTSPPTSCPPTGGRPTTRHVAPVLLEPPDGAVFSGPRRITFRWTGACCLAADEYFVVSIPHPRGVEEAWVKATAWRAPDYLYLLVPESRQLTWNVSVRRHTGQYPNGQWKGPIVSPLSETWCFTWLAEDRLESPLPIPESPLALP